MKTLLPLLTLAALATPLAQAQELPPLPPQAEAPTAEESALARELRDFIAELNALYASERPDDEVIAATRLLYVRADRLGARVRAAGSDKVRHALESTRTEQDRQGMLAAQKRMQTQKGFANAHQTLVFLALGIGAEPKPCEAPGIVALGYVDLAERMHAIVFSADSLAEKRAALRALKPIAAEVGKAWKLVGERAMKEHAAPIFSPSAEELAALDEAMADQAACGELIEDLRELAMGQPDPSLPVPAAEMAAHFRATLTQLPALVKDASISPQDKADALGGLTNGLYRSLIWARRRSVPEVDALAALLAPHAAEIQTQLESIDALIDSEDSELRDAADTFLMMFRDTQESFGINPQP